MRKGLNEAEVSAALGDLDHADLPAKTGLGSSSSFVVSLLQALNNLSGRSMPTNHFIPEEAPDLTYETMIKFFR